MKWFGARTLFRITRNESGRPCAIEQRVVLVRAENHDAALRQAEAEAREYASGLRWVNDEGQSVVGEYLDACEVHEIDGVVKEGCEVFSSTSLETRLTTHEELIERYWGPARDEEVNEALSMFEPDFSKLAGT